MANIQVKNVPERLHNQLRRYAREQGRTLGEIILKAIEREVWRWEWQKRFSRRPSTQLRTSAAQLLEEERRQRYSDVRESVCNRRIGSGVSSPNVIALAIFEFR